MVDGGKITTTNNNEKWKGIVLLGDPTKQQLPQYQGTIELKSGAIIENALCAIDAAPADYNYSGPCGNFIVTGDFGGGIIKADSATFYNNILSVRYSPYEFQGGIGIADNTGKFTNCTFITDSYYNTGNMNIEDYYYQIRLWGVRNVTFEGCLFEYDHASYGFFGIYSLDAGVKVKNYCSLKKVPDGIDCACPSSYTTPSIFRGFAISIDSENTGSWHQVYIDQSKFEITGYAVQIGNQNNYRVTRCDFENCLGIYSFNSSGYRIEENNFSGTFTSSSYGIAMYNSGIADNQIYKNDFKNCRHGIIIGGVNGTNNIKPPRGLQLKCNDFTDNQTDILGDFEPILPYQGGLLSGADNTFVGTINYSFLWYGSQPLFYYHSPGNNHAPYNSLGNVTVYNNAAPNECASTFCLPIGGKAFADLDSLEQYKMMQQQYDKLLVILDENPEVLQEILFLSDAMRELSDHAISRILGDSILYVENLKQWYEIVRTPVAKYSLAEGYFNERKYESAEGVLKEMPAMFAFNDFEMIEHENYMQFYHFKKQMILSKRNWKQLKESEIVQLQTIAEATNGRSAGMAKGVLCFFYGICYDDILSPEKSNDGILPSETEGNLSENNDKMSSVHNTQSYELSVYPNPTDGELIVEIAGQARNDVQVVKIIQLEVFDLTNRKVHQQTVNQSYSTLKMNELEKGVYILKVWLDNGEVIVKKIVKQ